MGKLLKPKGLKGELKVLIFNEEDSSLKDGVEVWLRTSDYFSHKIEKIKMAKQKSCIKFINCNAREHANALQGLLFYLPRDDFNSITTNKHYLIDMVESKVVNENKVQIGIVKDVFSIRSQNIIVAKIGKDEVLIPYIDDYVTFFDKEN